MFQSSAPLLSLLAIVLGCVSCGSAERRAPAQPVPATPPPASPATPPPSAEPERRADLAAAPLEDAPGVRADEWRERHEALLRAPGRDAAKLVILGDAIAQGWGDSRAFAKRWGKLRPLNLALAGEQTQYLLWRIEHGALDGLSPRLAIVAVGGENLTQGFSPRATAQGVASVVRRVHEELPAAAILVVGLLPAGQSPTDPRRAPIEAVNEALREVVADVAQGDRAAADRIIISDVGGTFLDADGSMSQGVMEEFRQPTPLGYEALTLSVSLVAERLLGNTARN